jgi:site-specific recombinase XerD
MAEFVNQRFIPDFVMTKEFAGRTHFRAILKHILPPETVAAAFGRDPDSGKDKLTTVQGWPYLDQFRLDEITTETIQELTAHALEQGYSIQTAVHLRNVIRSVFSYAIRTGHHPDQNPAAQVRLPIPARKKEHVLSIAQLRSVMNAMGYPEKETALFALLTGMNVGEICGLHWKDVNLSNASRITGLEVIPPRTIAVRNQSHRGKLSPVIDSRKRLLRVPRSLNVCLSELRKRKEFSGPHDLVLVSRNGTAIHPENVAARRLKVIGTVLGIPWLTWSTFYRTRSHLMKQPGIGVELELEKILQLE